MKQFGFYLKIKPEMKKEYKDAHDKIWPDYIKLLREAGLKNQSTFYREDGTLFLYFEAEDPEESLNKIADHPLNLKWQKEMKKFFKQKPKTKIREPDSNIDLLRIRPEVEILEPIYHED